MLAAGAEVSQDETPAAPPAEAPVQDQSAPSTRRLSRGELLLFEVDLNRALLTESLTAYGEPDDPLLPVGELARLLELAIEVNPAAGRAEGTVGGRQRSLVIDLPANAASIGGERLQLAPGDGGLTETDVFLRASLLEKLLPLVITVRSEDLQIRLASTEPLPLEQRRQREQRRILIGNAPNPGETSYELASPYRWLGYPAFDFGMELGRDDGRNGFTRRFEARVAADVLKTSLTGFVGTDDTGRPAAATVRLERRDPSGTLLGPLGVRHLAAGDVYTPALALGPRSFGGAGVVLSTAGLESGDVFQRITLRGELPLGYEVELYVNDVLRGSQNQAARGRYEFLDVPLVRGINVIRIVTYGPRGEREEQSRVINVGGGLLAPGELALDAGIVLQERPVLQLQRDLGPSAARGKPRAVASATLGLTSTVTGSLGMAAFSDPFGVGHRILGAGVRASVAGIAVQVDVAHDFGKGAALTLGAAGRLGEAAYVARHVEYTGRFEDETNILFEPARPLARHSELQLDASVPFLTQGGLPISLKARRAEYRDGGMTWQAQARTTLAVLDTLFAVAVDYQHRTVAGTRTHSSTGNLAGSRRFGPELQVRASLDFELAPRSAIRALSLTADRALSRRFGLRAGAAKAFGSFEDLTVFAAANARLPFGDGALSADYSLDRAEWRVALQVNLGFAFDPFSRGYRITPPGPASGASAAMLAFVDANGNGRLDAGEERVPGIRMLAGTMPAVTDSTGRAFLSGLGNSPRNFLRIDDSSFDKIFVTSPPQSVSFSSRPGQVLPVVHRFAPSSEVIVALVTRQADGASVGLAAVRFALVEEGGKRIEASTEFDGRAIIESVPPGRYRLVLDNDQAARLGMTLLEPIEIEVTTEGRAIRRSGTVVFRRDAS